MFNKRLFRAKMAEFGYTTKAVAVIIGCNEATLYRKIGGESDFTRNEIQLLKKAFNLSAIETEAIFFAQQLT